MNENIQKLKEWIQESDNVVFFGGAGVSTESGIPDFRSVDGLYNQKWDYPPETILSHSFFNRYPDEYYRFHREKLVIEGVKPNRAHIRLAELEGQGHVRAGTVGVIVARVRVQGGGDVAAQHAAALFSVRIHAAEDVQRVFVRSAVKADAEHAVHPQPGAGQAVQRGNAAYGEHGAFRQVMIL